MAAKAKKLCKLCHTNPAELPDRNKMGRPVKEVCRDCHAKRLAGDLYHVTKRLAKGG